MSDEQAVDQSVQTGPPLPIGDSGVNFPMAIAAGLVAAAVGAGVWYWIVVLTDTMLGIIAIGVGFLVGLAIKFGAGKQGAVPLQILGAVLALLSIVAGEYLIIHHWIRQANTDFTGWLTASEFIEVYTEYIKEAPITVLFYGIAVYQGYILPKPDVALDVIDDAVG
jgi:hypothetical protein